MTWNWQQPLWPKFQYDPSFTATWERSFFEQMGIFTGALRGLDDQDQQSIVVELLTTEAHKTSEIEGEILDRQSVQSSIQRELGFKTPSTATSPAEKGIATLTTSVYKDFSSSLTHETLHTWHKLVMSGRSDLAPMGAYRTDKEPMQIVSGAIGRRRVHFEAPPAERMLSEMEQFITWFNASHSTEPLLIRAAVAHLYFVSIHPFIDGNGRIARALTEKVLSQEISRPALFSISTYIAAHRKEYYSSLEQNNRLLDITGWLEYFGGVILGAQKQAQELVDFTLHKTRFFDQFGSRLNPRQKKVILKLFAAGPSGFVGGLSAENYLSITQASRATATRDLQGLVELRALIRTGERRYTRYWLPESF